MTERILIVDDDPDTIDFLNLILTRQGYQTLIATNGLEALSQAHTRHPDLIILDIMMPGIDGYEVARTLRRHPDTALIPILMFTAKAQVEDKLAGYEAGVDIYLTKPVHPVELQANIKALMSQKATQAASLKDKGRLIGVTAAKGGLGVSTIALNTAIACSSLAQGKHKSNPTMTPKEKIIAAELRPGQGSWSQELNLGNSTGLATLLRMSHTEITAAVVEGQLVSTIYGISLLLASDQSKDVELSASLAQYEVILQQIAYLAKMVFLDIGTNFLPAYDLVCDLCNEMILVTEPQPMALKRTIPLVSELRKKGFGRAKALTLVTANQRRADMTLSVSQIEKVLGLGVALGFPPSTELFYLATERAAPIYTLQTDGIVTQQFNKLAEILQKRGD